MSREQARPLIDRTVVGTVETGDAASSFRLEQRTWSVVPGHEPPEHHDVLKI
jgi:hypothetical protein